MKEAIIDKEIAQKNLDELHTVRIVIGKLWQELAAGGALQRELKDVLSAMLVSLVLLLLFNFLSVHNS